MDIDLLQKAVKIIEADGRDGLNAAARHVGMPTALALLIALLRRNLGSTETFPPDPEIDEKVHIELVSTVQAVRNFLGEKGAYFYTGRWYCFDNFSAFTVRWRGRLWATAEHAYQAAKFDDEEIIERIHNASSAHEAKKIGNDPSAQHLVRSGWQDVKHHVMEGILRAKLRQHPYVARKLKESWGMHIVEDSHRDDHWGRGPNWDGQNWLGEIWMKIRDEVYA